MRVGFNFARCIVDIVKGDVKLDEVALIVSRGTCMVRDQDVKRIVDLYAAVVAPFSELDRDECERVVTILYNTGRIHQPLLFKTHYPLPNIDIVWMDLAPSQLSDNESVKMAWDQYQVMLRLTSDTPNAQSSYQ